MGDWRYYVQRPGSGLWLDTNLQMADPELTWALSAPNSGKALIPAGMNPTAKGEDGRNVWGKWDTLLLAEENTKLAWAGICTAANPDDKGLHLEFIGTSGWLQGIPFYDVFRSWKVNVFDIVRMLVQHSTRYEPGFSFAMPTHDSMFSAGDTQPPAKPKEPPRRKGETKSEWQGSDRYNQYQKDAAAWNKAHGDKKQFEIAWWEASYVGEEIDTLAKEFGFDYRENVKWVDKGKLIPQFAFEFDDDLNNRRADIQFVDGMNLAIAIDPKDGNEKFAQHVIALGAGEGPGMARGNSSVADGRLYQAAFVNFKTIKDKNRLNGLAAAERTILSNTDPKIDTIVVWDIPGFAPLSTLRVGNEVQVLSQNNQPPIDAWVLIESITRNPNESVVTCTTSVVG